MIPLRRSAHPKYPFRGGSKIVSRISLRQMILEILKDIYLSKNMGGPPYSKNNALLYHYR